MKSARRNLPPLHTKTGMESNEPNLTKLAGLIRSHTPYDGSFELHIPGVHAIRASRTDTELIHAVAPPALCMIVQGAKRVMLGREVYEYDASRMLIYCVDLPVAAQITRASHSEPFLCFRLDINSRKIAELVLKVFPHGLPRVHESRAVCVTQADVNIFNAAARLIELTAQPADAELLAPLVIDEILIRLLRRCPNGPDRPRGVRLARCRESDILVAHQFLPAYESRRVGRVGAYECLLFSPVLQVRHVNEPFAVPEGAAPPGGEESHVDDNDGC
ncbi:MAG: hypothetical protein A4E57_03748 [Syntrophorhabdaceae bacterium PtaU1.Bin034]|nr:MAG: hypothetical protein A4E57_03748 [Syntrophorhabdaceae bacterium PtaU1.Bin034]